MIEAMKKRGIPAERIDMIRYCGIDFKYWLRGFDSTECSVKDTVEQVRNHPLIPTDITVRGFVINSVTGELTEVEQDGYLLKIYFYRLNKCKDRNILYVLQHSFGKSAYLCTVNKKKRLRFRLIINESSKRGRHKKVKIMMTSRNEENLRTLAMLRYQADRYQSMRNGTMSQRVNAEIRRLLDEMGANAKN